MQDAQTFVDLYEAQYPRVVAYARRRLGGLADAEDCAAEVFRLAWEQAATPSVGWLFVTARNLAYAHHRSGARLSELVRRIAAEEGSTPPGEADLGVYEALDQLPESARELLMAYYWDRLPGTECAELLGCTLPAVWVRLHRARQGLKAILLGTGAAPARAPIHIPSPQLHGGMS